MSNTRRIDLLPWILLAVGVALLGLSFVLDPTPTTYVHINGQRVPVTHDNAVDYAIGVCRVAGVVLAIAGAYLIYRRRRPDAVVVDDGIPPSGYDKYQNMDPSYGDPSGRSGIG